MEQTSHLITRKLWHQCGRCGIIPESLSLSTEIAHLATTQPRLGSLYNNGVVAKKEYGIRFIITYHYIEPSLASEQTTQILVGVQHGTIRVEIPCWCAKIQTGVVFNLTLKLKVFELTVSERFQNNFQRICHQ